MGVNMTTVKRFRDLLKKNGGSTKRCTRGGAYQSHSTLKNAFRI